MRVLWNLPNRFAGVILVLGVVAGCGGGGDVGMRARKSAAERPDVDRQMASKGALAIPGDAAFNLTSVQSGQTGDARGQAEMGGHDGISCRVEARSGGSAWGEFQLGYCFDNTAESALDATVKVRLTVSESTKTEQVGELGEDEASTAKSVLTFFIKDTNGLVLRRESLVSDEPEQGSAATSLVHELAYEARFEAGRGYYLVIAGRAEVQAAASQSVGRTLEVTGCSMELAWRGGEKRGQATLSWPTPRIER